MPRVRIIEEADDAVNRNIDAQNDSTGHGFRGNVGDADQAIDRQIGVVGDADDTDGHAARFRGVQDAGDDDAEGHVTRGRG